MAQAVHFRSSIRFRGNGKRSRSIPTATCLAFALCMAGDEAGAALYYYEAVLMRQAGEPFTCCNPQSREYMGQVLAAGDFNGDGIVDLAIGVPQEQGTQPPESTSGMVMITNGRYDGFGEFASNWSSLNIAGVAGVDMRLGEALASGDFNGDGFDDLAIGIPGNDVLVGPADVRMASGIVAVLYGGPASLSGPPQLLRQGLNLNGTLESGDEVGSSLAVGNFNGDAYDDLAIGVPREDHSGVIEPGYVHVVYGSASGLDTGVQQAWHQSVPDIPDAAQANERFGTVLAAGDLTGDGFDELIVSVPGEDAAGAMDSDAVGAIHVIRGSVTGLTAVGNQFITAADAAAEASTEFGSALQVLRWDDDASADLAVRVAVRDGVTPSQPSDYVKIYQGSGTGLNTLMPLYSIVTDAGESGPQLARWRIPDTTLDAVVLANTPNEYVWVVHPSVADTLVERSTAGLTADATPSFGSALVNGDFDGDGLDDLSIGIPEHDWRAAGGVLVAEAAGAVFTVFERTGHSNALKVLVEVLGTDPNPPDRLIQVGSNCEIPPTFDTATGTEDLLLFNLYYPGNCRFDLDWEVIDGYQMTTDTQGLFDLNVGSGFTTFITLTYEQLSTYWADCDADGFFDLERACSTLVEPGADESCRFCNGGTDWPEANGGSWTTTEPTVENDDCDDDASYATLVGEWYYDCDLDDYAVAVQNICNPATDTVTCYDGQPPGEFSPDFETFSGADCDDSSPTAISADADWFYDCDGDDYYRSVMDICNPATDTATCFDAAAPDEYSATTADFSGMDCDDTAAAATLDTADWLYDCDGDDYYQSVENICNPATDTATCFDAAAPDEYSQTTVDFSGADCDDTSPAATSATADWLYDCDGDDWYQPVADICNPANDTATCFDAAAPDEYSMSTGDFSGEDCDDEDPATQEFDICEICGGDGTTCDDLFEDGFESPVMTWLAPGPRATPLFAASPHGSVLLASMACSTIP